MTDVTQVILVTNPIQDLNQMTERMALFDEASGEPYPFSGEAWITVQETDMQNGWHAVVLSRVPYLPQYRKRPNGHVEIRGLIGPGSQGTMFNLPEGYRHTYNGGLNYPVATDIGYGVVTVMPNGDVVCLRSLTEEKWFGLSPVMFSVT